jgi:succinoglycan biosynthesis protein ExoO
VSVTEPDVSVILPTYNAEAFVERALASATDQSGVTVEVVVVDDASTDATTSVVDRLMADDPRIRLVRRETNAGPAAARNAGIAVARGRWIAVLDADDAFLPDRLSQLVAAAEAVGADAIADDFLHFDPRTEEVHDAGFLPGGLREVGLHSYLARARPGRHEPDYGLLKPLFRAAFLAEHRLAYPEHSRHGEDLLFMIDVLMSGARLVVGAEAGYLYSMRSGGWSRTTVDYEAMAAQSENLLRAHAVAGDAKARRLLRGRARAVRGFRDFVDLKAVLRRDGVRSVVPTLRTRPAALARAVAFYATVQARRRVLDPVLAALPSGRSSQPLRDAATS